jgi:hypothetical protein
LGYALKVIENPPVVIDPQLPAPPLDVVVSQQTVVSGQAMVSDGRALSEAQVEAFPLGCTQGGAPPACVPRWAMSQRCAADATGQVSCSAPGEPTAGNGSFSLALDPGAYVLRVRPREGTRLPWFTQPIVVGPSSVEAFDGSTEGIESLTGAPLDGSGLPESSAPPATSTSLMTIWVPAPVYAGLTLLDIQGNPIVNAVVRAFRVPTPRSASSGGTGVPTQGVIEQAVEVGRAMTDATGHYDMYLAPPAP